MQIHHERRAKRARDNPLQAAREFLPVERGLARGDDLGFWGRGISGAGNPGFAPGSSNEEIAGIVSSASGPSGSNRSYVLRLAQALREIGEDDPHVFAIERLLREVPQIVAE